MGEVGPFIRLGKALQERGHQVLLVTQGPYAEVAHKHGLEARALDTPEQFAAYAEDAELFNSPQGIQTLYQRHFLPLVSREVALLEEVTKAEDGVLVCRSTPGIAARLLSERDRCPLVPVLPGMSHLHTWPLTEVFFRDVLSSFVSDLRSEMGLPGRDDWEEWLRMPLRQVVFWPEWFDQPAPDCPLEIETVGFVSLEMGEGEQVPPLFARLAEQGKSPLLISGGTTGLAGERFFQAAIEAGQRLKRPVVVVTRRRDWLPERLPEDVYWFDRVPSLAECMHYSAALLHHSGLWTGVEAMEAAIPQLCCVGGTDRRVTASYFEAQGVARLLEESQWTPFVIVSALEELLSSSDVKAACKRAQSLCSKSSGVKRCCELVESIALAPESALVLPPHSPQSPSLSLNNAVSSTSPVAKDAPDGARARLLARLAKLSPEKRALLEKRLFFRQKGQEKSQSRPLSAPLSQAQRGLWWVQEMTEDERLYNISLVYHWPHEAALQPALLETALRQLVKRHGVFRSRFEQGSKGEMLQRLLGEEEYSFVLERVELSEDWEGDAARWAGQALSIEEVPLLRACWWETATRQVLGLKTHHLVLDAQSLALFLDELQELYNALSKQQKLSLPALEWQYVEYVRWQQEETQQKALERSLEWWKTRLDAPPSPSLPTFVSASSTPGLESGLCIHPLPDELVKGLERQAAELQVSRYQQLLALFQLWMFRVTTQRDLLNGLSVSNRDHSRVQGVVGLFLNTLVFRQQMEGEPSFETWVLHTQRELLHTLEHQHVPFEAVVEAVQPERSRGVTPLFQVMFNYQSEEEKPPVLGGFEGQRLEIAQRAAKFELTLSFEQRDGRLRILLDYNKGVFDLGSIERMGRQLEVLCRDALQHPTLPVTQLSLLSESERQQILYDWNNSDEDWPSGRCVHHLFEEWVDKQPHALAVVDEKGQWSYRELEERANRLAHALHKRGVGPDSVVGVCLQRSRALTWAWMGVLKAGGAFLPLDPSYPVERLQTMMEDADTALILTETSFLSVLPAIRGDVLCLDEWEEESLRYSDSRLETAVTPEALVYVISTSGSTGRPKGILLEHAGRVNNLTDMTRRYGLGPGDKVLGVSSPSFDICIYDTLGILGAGGVSLMTPALQHADPALWVEWIEREKATLWHSAPALLLMVVEYVEQHPQHSLNSLRVVILGGDWIPVTLPERLKKLAPEAVFVALGGATEASIHSTVYEVEEVDSDWQSIPYGRPMANQQVMVLDPWHNPVPVGVEGELHLGGVGLARGYRNREPLTREKFVHRPGLGALNDRLYRTGDRVRWREDGVLELLGRMDFQIKLRGHRIEPGEIESVLREHSQIQEALVMLREDEPGQPRLVAYLYLHSFAWVEKSTWMSELRDFLRSRLPAYMLPSRLVPLESFPLSPNGKIDRRALPAPTIEEPTLSPSLSPVERELAGIWGELLGEAPTSIDAHFFEMGGHSLLATRLLARVGERWGTKPSLRWFFVQPVLGEMVRWLEETQADRKTPLSSELRKRVPEASVPLTYAQQRLWFLEELFPGESTYHVPLALEWSGPWHRALWLEALERLTQRHEALRSFVKTEGDHLSTGVLASLSLQPDERDLSHLPPEKQDAHLEEEIQQALRRPFALSEGPLVRCTVWHWGEERHLLLLEQHHLITDGWSVQMLVRELDQRLKALLHKTPLSLPPVKLQYGDYAVWEQSEPQRQALSEALEYWRETLKEPRALLELPTDLPRPRMPSTKGFVVEHCFAGCWEKPLRSLTQSEGVTRYMTFLAAWQVFLYRLSGETDLCIGTPVAHRQDAALEQTAGFFVNTLVIRQQLRPEMTFVELLREVKDTVLQGFAHQDVPFEQLVEELEPRRDPSHHPLFQVMFSYDEQPLEEVSLGDVRARLRPLRTGRSKFDLMWSMLQRSEGLTAVVEANTGLFVPETIHSLLHRFEGLLLELLEEPEQSLLQYSLVTEKERRQILYDWNPPSSPLPEFTSVAAWFSAQAAKTPDATAICYGELRRSYRELDEASNRVAHLLREKGVGPEVCVGFLMERSVELFVGLWGIWKAGGAYVALHPDTPPSRMRHLLDDTDAALLVTLGTLADRLPETELEVVLLDTDVWKAYPSTPLNAAASFSQLAYVLYTSGSTGKPRGVAIEHRSLLNFLGDMEKRLSLKAEDHWLSVTALTFDISVLELCLPLLTGATVTVIPWLEAMDGEALARRLDSGEYTWMQATPSVWRLVVDGGWKGGDVSVLCGGEALSLELAKALQARAGRFWNVYGPTETTIWSTALEISGELKETPSIGQPMTNTRCLVLDAAQKLCPPGIPGELVIGGEGLARGYFGLPQQTAARFVSDPFHPGERMYLTGDRARWTESGELEFLGRVDHQVKLRGFRIELGEIEVALAAIAGIEEAVVQVRRSGNGDERLVAWLRSTGKRPLETSLREVLRGELPPYMVPAAFVWVEEWPLLSSGKIHRRALPDPGVSETQDTTEEPQGEVERQIAVYWSELLQVESVGREEDFFVLGGHSLLGMRLFSRLRKEFEVEVPLRLLFESPTVASLAQAVEEARREGRKTRRPTLKKARRQRQRVRFTSDGEMVLLGAEEDESK
jgi:amino acid adenylation domain-containing protein